MFNLAHRPPEAVLNALVPALKDKNEIVRFTACQSLIHFGPPTVPAFLNALKDKDAFVRRVAAGALGEPNLQAEAAIPALGETLLKDKDTAVRQAAARKIVEATPAKKRR